MSFTWTPGDELTADRLNQANPGTISALAPLENNILQLFLENFFAGKSTPFQGLFFDGFSDETKTELLSGVVVLNTVEKKLELVLLAFPAQSGLISHWKLDEASGTRFDEEANNNDLTDINTVGQAAGKLDFGADFEDANDESLSINDASQTGLDITGDISISAWLNIENAPSDTTMRFITKFGSGADRSYMFEYQDISGTKSMRFIAFDGAEDIMTVNGDLGTGTFKHVVLTWKASTSTFEFFIDKVSQGTAVGVATSMLNGAAAFVIGGKDADATKTFDGVIDEVGIWNRVLTSGEITELFDNPTATSTGFYRSVVSTFQTAKKSLKLWVVRNFSARFNLAGSISASDTTLILAEDQTGKFADADTIDIYEKNNFVRERKTISSIVFDLATSLDAYSASLLTNLISYWKLDESSGSAADSIGSLTLTNNNSTPYVAGILNNGADFEASSSQFLSNSTGLGLTTDFSLSMWVKIESQPTGFAEYNFAGEFDSSIGAQGSGWRVRYIDLGGGTIRLALQFTDGAGANASFFNFDFSGLTVGTFAHIVFTVDISAGGAGIKLFIDDVEKTPTATQSNATTLGDPAVDFNIGANNGAIFTDGIIDEVGIWTRILTQAEIGFIFQTTTITFTPAIVNSSGFDADAFIERVDVLPQVSLVDFEAADDFKDLTFEKSITDIVLNTFAIDLEKDSDQYLSAEDSESLSITGDLTLEAWIKPETTVAPGFIIAKHDIEFDATKSYSVDIQTSNVIRFLNSDGTEASASTTTIWEDGEWHHLAISYDASAGTCKFYKDGVHLVGEDGSGLRTSINDVAKQLRIGATDNGGAVSFPFDGLIDEVRIWNRIRTDDEILINFDKALVGNELNLVAYYRLNNSLLDGTVNDNDLTNNNSAVFSTDVAEIGTKEVEDEYSFTALTAEEDFKVKLNLSREDTSLSVEAKRLGVSLTDE